LKSVLKLRFVVDVFAIVTLIVSFFSGLILWLFLPRGRSVFLGVLRHEWINIHTYWSIAFLLFALFHLMLNLKQLIAMAKRIFRGTVKS